MTCQTFSLSQPHLFQFEDAQGCLCQGLDQTWYPDPWQRKAGCGPTTASTLMTYLAQTKPSLSALAPAHPKTVADILPYMELVWQHVTPTAKGLHTLELFTEGCKALGSQRASHLYTCSLPIPGINEGVRPTLTECILFLQRALESDCPVAFLNYSNGALSNLDSWHWVPLISLSLQQNGDTHCTILDAGGSHTIDFSLWYSTTSLGGGLVSLHPCSQP